MCVMQEQGDNLMDRGENRDEQDLCLSFRYNEQAFMLFRLFSLYGTYIVLLCTSLNVLSISSAQQTCLFAYLTLHKKNTQVVFVL